MQSTKINIFDRPASVFSKASDTEPRATRTLFQVLTNEKVRPAVEALRLEPDSDRRKELKKNIPAFTASGTITGKREDGNLSHNGVICIDIDRKDNMNVINFDEIKTRISKIPCIAYCGLSVGGQGYFLLVPVSNPEKHREHYQAFCDDLERCGAKVDRSCINVSRLRFMSYDPDAYFNYEAKAYTRLHQEKKEAPVYNKSYDSNAGNDVEKLISEIQGRHTDITGDYQQWLEIGAAIASEFGESGRNYFHAVSRYSDKYKAADTDKKYNECMKMRNFNIGTLYYYAKQNGIEIHGKSQPACRTSSTVRGEYIRLVTSTEPAKAESKSFTLGELAGYANDKGLTGREVKGELYGYLTNNGLSTKSLQIK